MNWKNLKTNTCPHCNGELEEVGGEFKCTYCRFHIDSGRKLSIEVNRAYPEKAPTQKVKWQNLHDERCPICSTSLDYGIGEYEILACLSPDCSFKIRHDRFREIMSDPHHPCNQFYERNKQKIHGTDE